MSQLNVLVLCHANRWRSPLAAGLLRKHLEANNLHQVVTVRSSGFKEAGRPAGKPVRNAALELGFSLEDFRSSLLDVNQHDWADLFVHMGRGNYARLQAFRKKYNLMDKPRTTACLGNWTDPPRSNIEDLAFISPHLPKFDEVVRYIDDACKRLVETMIASMVGKRQHNQWV